ncbi:TIR domain-containing protein [Polaromonas sp.]|uniref:TIR domain-containing protein n=1 Tax=Polaromonas sp. TaxID=1869339 RepID=UPI002730F789|nr:TIR domain-containing protein [Polaromonas sp.]MDP1743106.1 TIR domain-containing protein [Polaromonas sp.]
MARIAIRHMTRRVFFSFHWERDIWRANVVRNSWLTVGGGLKAGYYDHADIEKIKLKSTVAIQNWIDRQLLGASVTCVLIGNRTAERKHVQYEISRSRELGKAIFGVRINQIKDQHGCTDWEGPNPFAGLIPGNDLLSRVFSSENAVPVHDWNDDDGRTHFSAWVEAAAKLAGK